TEHADLEGGLAVAVGLDQELQPVSARAHVAGSELGTLALQSEADDGGGRRPIGQAADQFVVLVDDRYTVGGKGLEQLALAGYYPLHRLEALEMLRADRREHADTRAQQPTEEGDVAGHPVAQLGD